jgi:hypothetical protein
VLKVGAEFITLFLKRRLFDGPEKVEESTGTKLDMVVSTIGKMESDLRVLVTEFTGHKATVGKVEERVEGMSRVYGPKMDSFAESIAKLQVQVSELQKRRAK